MKNFAFGVAISLFVASECYSSVPTYAAAPSAPSYAENTCGRHQTLVGHNCECKKGYIRFNGACVKCPQGSRYSCKSNICKCDGGKVWDVATNTCQKVQESYPPKNGYNNEGNNGYNNQGNNGYNNQGYVKPQEKVYEKVKVNIDYSDKYGTVYSPQTYSGLPKGGPYGPNYTCPKLSYWSAQFPCTCNWGLGWKDYDCVPNCGIDEVFTPGAGCTCRKGYNKYDGVTCTYCPPRSYWEAGYCYCEWGLVEQNGKCIDPSASYNNGYSAPKGY